MQNEESKSITNGYAICWNQWALDKRIKSELNVLLIISSLTAKDGVCYASNEYLASAFDTTEETISRKISKLEKLGYITIDYYKYGCAIDRREIRLTKTSIADYQKRQPRIDENVKENNTSNNIISTNTIKKENIEKEVINNYEFDPEVEKAINTWLQYKKERKQTYKQTGLNALLKKIEKDAQEYGYQYVVNEIEHSIECNYSGIYPPKANQSAPQRQDEDFYDRLDRLSGETL